MKWTSLNDLREKYLSFFESKGHLRLPSFPLVPQHDKSLLLINAGMAPLKKYFTGEEEPPRHRVTTCQKCIRTLDIDNVGKTARHGTYFEMLGNFSFGDYFKDEAIPWAWEFLTKVLEIPEDRLYPSVYEEDEEAFKIWNEVIGVPAERIVRLGRDDNFWELGSGPCGPCSEIYFDRGEKYGCGKPGCYPGCDCDRYMEIWNNVFSQFNSDGQGGYTELEHKNIDTGMGLERLACVMQDVDNMFEVDTVRKILDAVCSRAGITYGTDHNTDVSVRVITDHIRSSTFLISDGVLPSNEGRGYVLRRLLRRGARHGKLLGIEGSFLAELCQVVIDENEGAYPELREKTDYIKKVISLEEERFQSTIDSGLEILQKLCDKVISEGGNVLEGADAFKLYDTFGFPVDLTREIAAERGLTVDEEGFTALMTEQKERARRARADMSGWDGNKATVFSALDKTEFTGYDGTVSEGKVIMIVKDGESVPAASEGEVQLVLSRTPFYGEGGGQVGDRGVIESDSAALTVIDTKKTDGVYIHICNMEDGTVAVGDVVRACVDSRRRRAICSGHSGIHLLHAALRTVLGTHVEQAGSYVDDERLRFDFSHFSAMTADEIARTESLVNEWIAEALPVVTVETDVETARAEGAMALFGEKYGKTVRMVKMGDVSTELCGGTHCSNTSMVGLFKIVSESSVAAGVRRIEGVTAAGVLKLLGEKEELISDTAAALKSTPAEMAHRARSLSSELSAAKKEAESLNAKLASGKLDAILSNAVAVKSVKLAAADLGEMKADAVRGLCDRLKNENPDMAMIFAIRSGAKINFVAACGADAVKAGAHAGKLAGAVSAVTGGKGGGRPDSAMAGGQDASRIAEAIASAKGVLEGMVK
jgi:alanyl-tRNA synthetase